MALSNFTRDYHLRGSAEDMKNFYESYFTLLGLLTDPANLLTFRLEEGKYTFLLVPAALEAAAGQEICNTAGRLLILRLEIDFKELKGLPRSSFLYKK